MTNVPIALTMGEPAGIGGEIALKAWQRRRGEAVPSFFIIDDPNRLEYIASDLNLPVPVRAIDSSSDAGAYFDSALPVLPQFLETNVAPGKPDVANAGTVIKTIERAVSLVTNGAARAVVTNPIEKAILTDAGFPHPGHTEFLAELAGREAEAVMMLVCAELRVVPVTIHISLAEAAHSLTGDAILQSARVTAASLKRDFGINKPRLAVAGLNPHAGEKGAMGREEIEIIAPALEQLRDEGIDVRGPFSADTLFHAAARRGYDAAICMYHDQALIPIKTINFEGGVNTTIGLPFVRTSPDHGTALDIAGKGTANPSSLIAALRLAAEMAANRIN